MVDTSNDDDGNTLSKDRQRAAQWIADHARELAQDLDEKELEIIDECRRNRQLQLCIHILGHKTRRQARGLVEMHGVGHFEPPRLVTPPPSERDGRENDQLVGTTAFARHVGLEPQTIRDHLAQGRLIGWVTGVKKKVLPLNQLGPGNRYIPDLQRVLEYFEDPAVAWLWLTQPNASTHHERPLDRLHAGHVDEVIYAANLYDQGAFT
ncbi:hypothetical protein [Salinisphaera hydrothermalis]|uniref:hypothetical protein n=1 Tax=Salinisphaera hydrothermalis TaxID=563188 RepID=UPI00333FD2F2